jgi:hypothetical protein
VGPDLDHHARGNSVTEQLAKRPARRGDRVFLEDLTVLVQHAVLAPTISKIHTHRQPRFRFDIILHGRPPPWA